jgi:2-iminobutanoate/2-iminopropanoate deaminase
MEIIKVQTKEAPEPGGHYSQGIIANNMVFVAGMVPVVPGTGEKITGSIEEQTLQVLKNIKGVIVAAGSDLNKVVKVTVYVSDISLWDGVNKVYSSFFGNHKPARAIVPVKDLHYGFKLEMDAIAVI